ncbi:MAG: hypothetical protein AUK28_02955 [Desulfobacterales bacterium CG2_30_60_27]|nr:MAG: hypothetical protein AUK28_02955 [Desulfobacterales bacterium CG2_30_60_27]
MSEEKLESDIDDWMGELSDEENPFDEEARLAMEGPPPSETTAPAATSASDLAESIAAASPIDQSEIDTLLGSQEPAPPAAASPEESAGLDQSDIDSLFGGGEEAAAAPEMDQDHINQLLGEVESLPPGLDEELIGQGIDQALDASLMAGASPAAEPLPLEKPATAPEFGEFYQANMDELLVNAAEQPEAASDSPALEQSDLDQLLGTDAEPAEAAVATPSQEEMDQLFAKSAGEEEELFPSEPTTPTAAVDEAFGFAGNELDDAGGDESATAEPGIGPAVLTAIDEKSANPGEEKLIAPTEKKKAALPVWLHKAGGKRALWGSVGASLVLLLSLAGYFTLHSRPKTPNIATAPPAPVAEPAVAPLASVAQVPPPAPPAAPPEAANQAPQSMSMEVAIPVAAKEISVALRGQDPDNDPIEFVITELPTAGRLTGKTPDLIYTPAGDFPGTDRFVYRTSDGKALSEAAEVRISGQPASPAQTVATSTTGQPGPLTVAATDLTMKTTSTAALDIDWRAVWQKANPKIPFSKKVTVEIIDKKLQGTLTRLNARHHRYAPDPQTDGREWLRYRFTLAGVRSQIRQLNIQIKPGDQRPALALCPLNQQAYTVGDTVVLNASPTRSNRQANVVFSWHQIAGVPVRLEPLNQAGSVVSFVVPSSFYSVDYPEPVIRVTAKDQAGHEDSREITIKVQPNRQAALWNGLR